MQTMTEKSVSEQVADLRARWNPPPEDHTHERVVGIPVPEGDTRATNHEPMSVTNAHINAGNDDPDAFDDDLEDEDYSDWDHQALKDEIDQRNENRDEDDRISKAGSSDDLRARLIADDEAEEDNEE